MFGIIPQPLLLLDIAKEITKTMPGYIYTQPQNIKNSLNDYRICTAGRLFF